MQGWHLLFSGTATGGGSRDNYHVQQGSVCVCLCGLVMDAQLCYYLGLPH